MRVFGLTVGRNETGRYLIPMLSHALSVLDDVFFYDDQSDDETGYVINQLNCSAARRPHHVPSFADDEGLFRGAAWQAFEDIIHPQLGDWVLVIDCDEILVGDYAADPTSVRSILEKVITAAGTMVAVNLNIPEVFGYDQDEMPLIRVDGLWNTIHAPRLFAYRPGGQYASGLVGVPAVPSYVMGSPWFTTDLLWLMHYGYADPADQSAKYARYNGKWGHSNAHVQSIVGPQTLHRWDRPYVPVMISAGYQWKP